MFADLSSVEVLQLPPSLRTQGTKLLPLAARFRRKFLAFTPRMPLCYDRRAVLFASFIPSSKKESGTPKGANSSIAATVVAARVLRDALTFRRSAAALASGM
jgi:hypothetical protein